MSHCQTKVFSSVTNFEFSSCFKLIVPELGIILLDKFRQRMTQT